MAQGIYVVIEEYGSAYALGEDVEELIQHPLNRDGTIDKDGGGAVAFDCIDTGEREFLRYVAAALDRLDTAAIGRFG